MRTSVINFEEKLPINFKPISRISKKYLMTKPMGTLGKWVRLSNVYFKQNLPPCKLLVYEKDILCPSCSEIKETLTF